MTRKLLVFAPHPDDEVIGCVGPIRRALSCGTSVVIVYVTSGDQGVDGCCGAQREAEAVEALRALGAGRSRLIFMKIPDGGICPEDPGQFEAVLALIRDERPDMVILPHEAEGSFDHVQTHRLVWRALAMSGSRNHPRAGAPHWVPTALSYEVWTPMASPAHFVDLDGDDAEAKAVALSCYRSQSKGDSQPEYAGVGGLSLARFRGAMTIGGHREAFGVLRLGEVSW
ncbi:MAG: N-acetylglucosamine malate deacetylase 1 [Actinomycetota bacterium]|nr:N-acetylglucosamine malate deacetylase 1 [Actinomycetota bacterium]